MAKKSTTGLPTRQKRPSDAEDRRSYLSRAEREARAQRWVLLGIGLALGLALVIIIAGLVVEQLITPNQPIAVVNGETVTTREFDKRVRFERWQSGQVLINVASLYGTQVLTDQSSPFYQQFAQLQPGQEYLIGGQVRDVMVDEILIRKEAEARGLTVDDEAVEARIQEYFGYAPEPEEPAPTLEPSATPTPIVSPTPSPVPTATPEPEETPEPTGTPLPTLTPAPTLTAEELVERYTEFSTEYFDEAAKVSGMTRDELRRVFETQVLRDQLRDVITADIGPSEEQTNARHILVETEQEAQDILTALSEGEDFAELARSASIDTGSGASGGELGWAGPGRYVPEFEDAVLNAEIDAIVGPVQTQFGYHIIQVTAREVRELTEAELEQKKETAFTDWLTEQRDAATIEYPVSYVERTPGEPTLFDLGLLGAATGS